MSKIDNNTVFRVVLIVLAAFVLFALISYYNSKQNQTPEKFFNASAGSGKQQHFTNKSLGKPGTSGYQDYSQQAAQTNPVGPTNAAQTFASPASASASAGVQKPMTPAAIPAGVSPSDIYNEDYRAVDYTSTQLPSDCFPKDRLTSQDLLPKDAANSTWSQVATNGQGDIGTQNFLTAGYHVGISTISGSLRNSNRSIRSEPPNPIIPNLTPFNMTTITPDVLRKNFEIGSEC